MLVVCRLRLCGVLCVWLWVTVSSPPSRTPSAERGDGFIAFKNKLADVLLYGEQRLRCQTQLSACGFSASEKVLRHLGRASFEHCMSTLQ